MSMDVKALFHVHTDDDPLDKIPYSIFKVLDRCHENGIEIVALTCHTKVISYPSYMAYAQKKNILLLCGIESTIEGKHVLLINATKGAEKINTFKQLAQYKIHHPSVLVIAPHPYIPFWHSLGKKLSQYSDLFDALEYHWFYSPWCNYNKKTIVMAKTMNKPLVGTSDVHTLRHMFYTYSVLSVDNRSPVGVVDAVKKGHVHVVTHPYHLLSMVCYFLLMLWRQIKIGRKKY